MICLEKLMNEAEVSVLSLRKGLYKYQMLNGIRLALCLASWMCSCNSHQQFSTRKVSSLKLQIRHVFFVHPQTRGLHNTPGQWWRFALLSFRRRCPKCPLTIAMSYEMGSWWNHWQKALNSKISSCCGQRICSSSQQICEFWWLAILLQAVFHLIYAGLFWFVLPSSLVICNDIMAYYCGQVRWDQAERSCEMLRIQNVGVPLLEISSVHIYIYIIYDWQ